MQRTRGSPGGHVQVERGLWQTRKERMSPTEDEGWRSARGRAGHWLSPRTDFIRAASASDFHSEQPVPGQPFQRPLENGQPPRACLTRMQRVSLSHKTTLTLKASQMPSVRNRGPGAPHPQACFRAALWQAAELGVLVGGGC